MSAELSEFVRLVPLGFFVGAYGTLVGAGGGSLLVPALLVLLPAETPATITAISMAVVFFNAYAGTISYMRMGRIDYRAGTMFTLAGIPGAILGTLLVHEIPRRIFDPMFGLLLLGIGAMLVANPLGSQPGGPAAISTEDANRRDLFGSIGSAYIAAFATLLGIGGGIIHVPFLIRLLRMPPHTATATSHFVLTFMALTATATHLALGEFDRGLNQTMYLAVGVMMGAPLGAMLSTRMRGSYIVRLLAFALCLVGVRLLVGLL